MIKIPTIFVRDEANPARVTDLCCDATLWVFRGEGRATRKRDGTACLVRGGALYKRFDAKQGRNPPPGFEPCEPAPDAKGHWPGWVRVGDGPEDRWHREALASAGALPDGTYELCGPRVQSNAEGLAQLQFFFHGGELLTVDPADLHREGLRAFLERNPMEGVVWHHRDGRMAKIKSRDLGLPWPVK